MKHLPLMSLTDRGVTLHTLTFTCRDFLVLLGFAISASLAAAGPLTVFTESGGTATIDILYIGGGEGGGVVKDGGAGDTNTKAGEITYTVQDEDQVRAAALRAKVKIPDPANPGKYIKAVSKMGYKGALGTSLQSFEPLDVDQFVPPDENLILLFDFDIPLFLQSGVDFSEGQVLTVVNGSIAGVNGLVFRDASSLFTAPDSFFDVFIALDSPLWNDLPLYSGQVTVASHLEFRLLVEPGTLALVIGMLLFLVWRHSGPRLLSGESMRNSRGNGVRLD